MIGSTTPVSEYPDWHPVHRANALLREALQNTTRSFESLEAQYSVESLSDAIESVMRGPVQIPYPKPLAARLDDLPVQERTIPGLEALMHPAQHAPGDTSIGFSNDREDDPAPDTQVDAFSAEIWDDPESAAGFDASEPLRADAPLDPTLRPRQIHMETLLGEFQRRQRHASLLVAASIVTAALLTIGGVVLAACLASPRSLGGDGVAPSHSSPVVWKTPAVSTAGTGLQLAAAPGSAAVESEPPSDTSQKVATPAPVVAASFAPQTILAASGRQIALGPLLPPSHARYFMIRGLPALSTLSAGRQSDSGTWLVKGENIPDLTLTLGQTPAGDYPVEVYILESGDGLQARRSFILRIQPNDRGLVTASGSNLSTAEPAGAAAPVASAMLREKATQLLSQGDIAAARQLLLHSAQGGDGEAAYDLARTFDRQVLAELGAKGADADPTSARDWYERASQAGNVKAAERLKVLASLSGTPSD
jgi:hypothetical protein